MFQLYQDHPLRPQSRQVTIAQNPTGPTRIRNAIRALQRAVFFLALAPLLSTVGCEDSVPAADVRSCAEDDCVCRQTCECRDDTDCEDGMTCSENACVSVTCEPSDSMDSACSQFDPNTPYCVAVNRCGACIAENNEGCSGETPMCDPETNSCTTGCDPEDNDGCSGETPICDPNTNTCTGCIVEDNEGCSGETPICDATTNRCTAGCDPENNDGCSGETPLCDPNTNTCTECLAEDNEGCSGETPICDATTNRCTAGCVPENNEGCSGDTPICDPATNTCTGCLTEGDEGCSGDTPICDPATNTCTECLTEGNEGCSGDTPVCDPATNTCTGCLTEGDEGCSGDTPICDPATNTCAACDTMTHEGCDASAPFCHPDDMVCVPCLEENHQGCSAPEPYCNGAVDICTACLTENNEGCTDQAPVCDSNTYVCRGCESNPECVSGLCNPDGRCADEADIIYVGDTGNAPNDAGDCSRLAPCATGGYAMTQATQDRNIILFYPGTYTETLTLPSSPALRLIAHIDATLAPTDADRAIATSTGTIASFEGITIDNPNAVAEFGINCQTDAALTLVDTTLGNFNDAGIRNDGCDVTLERSFSENNPVGIRHLTGTTNITGQSQIRANVTGVVVSGGSVNLNTMANAINNTNTGISVAGGDLTLSESAIVESNPTGISVAGGNVMVTDSTLYNNDVGLTNTAFVTIEVRDSVIDSNITGIQGGFDSHFIIEDSEFRDNGVGISMNNGKPQIRRCQIRDNQTGISTSRGALTIDRTEITGNTTIGVVSAGSWLTFQNSIIAKNGSATSAVGGARITPNPSSFTPGTFRFNTVVDNISASNGISGLSCGGTTFLGGSVGILLRGSGNGAAATNCNPFSFSNVEGGADPTRNIIDVACPFIDAAAGDYHLDSSVSNSCIDAGGGSGPTTDIDGETRPSGLARDIGADEAQ